MSGSAAAPVEQSPSSDGRGDLELLALLGVPALAVLPELFDVDAFKTAVTALFAGAVLLPWFAWRAREDFAAWLRSPGSGVLLCASAWMALAATGRDGSAAHADRLLGLLLAQTAALAGWRAARRAPAALGRAVLAFGLVVAALATVQAAGVERVLNAGTDEIVSTFGNTTRAGLCLAFVVVAAFGQLLAPRDSDAPWRQRYAAAALNLGLAALLLTRARGGWLAAGCGLLVVAAACRGAVWPARRAWGGPAAVGLGLALVLGDGPARLFGPKLAADEALLSAGDVTAGVRLSIWRGTLELSRDAPWTGHGLGSFRQVFPAYREPEEAALPGRHGLPTEVDHPHNEVLLALAEGGWPAAVLLSAFALLALRSGLRRVRGGGDAGGARQGDVIALGICVAGCVGALLQNAWTTPGTALPFFAAAGWLLAKPPGALPGSRAARRSGPAVAALLLAAAATCLSLAPARAAVHWHWWRFFVAAERDGLDEHNLQLLVRAAEAGPDDVDIQRRLATLGEALLALRPELAGSFDGPLRRARERVARLAPGSAPGS